MLIEIDPHSGVPIYRQLEDQVRRQILTGGVANDAALVSVRDLAAKLKINPLTVSKAYSALEREGLLERRRGIGLFVKRPEGQRLELERLELLNTALRRLMVEAKQLGISRAELEAALAKILVEFEKP